MSRNRICVEITDSERQKIEASIKASYPKLKNVSAVVRAALDRFLETAV